MNYIEKVMHRTDNCIFVRGYMPKETAKTIGDAENKTVVLLGDSEIVESEVIKGIIQSALQKQIEMIEGEVKEKVGRFYELERKKTVGDILSILNQYK